MVPPPRPRRHSPAVYRRRRALAALVVAAPVVAVAALVRGTHPGGRPPAAQRAAGRSAPAATPLDPAAFAEGACVALAPTAGDRRRTVVLDAGHGGIDPGAVGTTPAGATVTEGRLNLPIELDAATRLRSEGFRVVVTRTADTTVARLGPGDQAGGALTVSGSHADVIARVRCADLAGASALVGLYLDAGGPGQAGSVTLYDADRSFSAASGRLAGLVQGDVLAYLDARGWAIPDGGAVPDSGYGSSVAAAGSQLASAAAAYDHLLLLGPAQAGYNPAPTTAPGVVIEPLFLTDPFEAGIAASPAGQQVVAAGVAAAVTSFLAPPPPAPAPPGTARRK